MKQEEYAARLEAVRGLLDSWEVDALLVSEPANRHWLSGFAGSAGTLLITHAEALLATDSRYWIQAKEEAAAFTQFKHDRSQEATLRLLQQAGAQLIGLESDFLTYKQVSELQQLPGLNWRMLESPLQQLRQKKSEAELSLIREAARITDEAMASVTEMLYVGLTERALAWELEKRMRENGADAMAFPPIVAFGTHSAKPHHRPGDRELADDDIVLVDMGGKFGGYCSDLTRTFLFHGSSDGRFDEIYGLVQAAQQAAVSGLRPGMDTQQAHALAADVISTAGFGAFFSHGLGHGLGLDIHEEPFLSAIRPPQPLHEGMVITVEPGIYLSDWGGVRLEDLVRITADGAEKISLCRQDYQSAAR